MRDENASDGDPHPPLFAANDSCFGLFPGQHFRLATGECTDTPASPQALWFFRHEPIAVPLPGQPMAGFSRQLRVYADVAAWHAATPVGSVLEAPPLVWTGAHSVVSGRLGADAASLHVDGKTIPLSLVAKHPLNRSYFDHSSTAFFDGRKLRLRGDFEAVKFVARTLWPEDFRLPGQPPSVTIDATSDAFSRLLRTEWPGDPQQPFSCVTLWKGGTSLGPRPGQPVIAFMLNGAQGDDDEAHAGHFALATGHVGQDGAIGDWLVSNYYTLDSESEKGIIAAPVPLDNYLADLNAGQAWYRPSWMLVATLRDERTARHLQSALGRVFIHFYGHRFSYRHASDNCTGISISTLRALGWQVPERGAESWLRGLLALPFTSLRERNLEKGKAAFDYFTEDMTRLYPAVAFAEIGADLLRLTSGTSRRHPGDFERMLAEDIDSLLCVSIRQFPSSRATGSLPVASGCEYLRRLPGDPSERQIIPVGPRPFPRDFIDPDAPDEPLRRSDYALAGYLAAVLLATLALMAI